ncbi:MAG TPA: dephospho-CoA kinase [Flavobacteriaceae bacterium]|nr:dephospho-CoA kinase [Flavobacteriaceae bacterium]
MFIIGLTGGIGSGKSTVANFFYEIGIPIYYADIEAKKLMITSKIIKKRLIARFGEEVYFNNELNKPFLANLIFTNKENLNFVNSVVHPKVNQHFKRWVKKNKIAGFDYVIQENAILFENGSNVLFDKIICITAPIKLKTARVISRDNTTEKQVLNRMKNQWTDEQKIIKSDFVINNLDLETTKKQVNQIHNEIINLL